MCVMRKDRRLKVRPYFLDPCPPDRDSMVAVTLEGTIIHKSGLITGGKSTHNNGKKWDEKDVQGSHDMCLTTDWC